MIIDDDPAIREDYKKILTPESIPGMSEMEELERALFSIPEKTSATLPPFDLDFASQGKEGYKKVLKAREEGRPFAVAFVDVRMPPGWDGLETSARIRKRDSDIEIVIVTAYSDRDRWSLVEAVGDPSKLLYLKKPFDPDEIRQLAHSLTEKWNLLQREREYKSYLENLLELFSSIHLDAENEEELLQLLLKLVAKFFHANAASAFYKSVSGERIKLFTPTAASNLPEMRPPFQVPESVEPPVDGKLAIPLRTAAGEGTFLLDISASSIAPQNAQLLGRIIHENITNIFNVFHFQQELIEKQRLSAIGNAVFRIIHDINNPVSAILGFALLIEKDRNTNEKDLRRVKNILAAAENIKKLTDSLHDLISEDIHLRLEKVDLRSLLLDVSAKFQPLSEKSGVDIVLALPDDPVFVNMDSERFRRILSELLENSLEATERSRKDKCVEMGVSTEGGELAIWVKDTGLGIPEAEKSKIWAPFYSFRRRNRLGLGLPLCKKFITLMKGRAVLESELNEGTTVTLYIPLG